MKTIKLIRRIVASTAFALIIHFELRAQTWETVLDYQDVQIPEGNGGIAADLLGNVFAGGNIGGSSSGAPRQGVVLRTDNTQSEWFLSDQTSAGAYESQHGLGIDGNGHIYSLGEVTFGSSRAWSVRKSTDSGLTWSTVDFYQYASGKSAGAFGFATDNLGNIYVAGSAQDKGGASHWVVRKSNNGGQSWATADDYKNASPRGLYSTPDGALFAVGGGGPGWFVRRSLNAGLTWTTVDNPFSGWAQGVTSDNFGNIYVAGRAHNTSGKSRSFVSYDVWTIRKSSDGGNSWATIDSFSLAPSSSSSARAIGKDAIGNIVAVGYADGANAEYWTVRTLLPSGSWQTMDAFQLAPNGWADASSLTVDAAGNLLVAGSASDANGAAHWIVRRFTP